MSWRDAVRRALEREGIEVAEDQRGLVAALRGGPTLLIVSRRLQMSLDRKVEVLGTFEVARPPPQARDALLAMLSSSFEVELRGILRKSLVWRAWREARKLEGVVGRVPHSPALIEELRGRAELVGSLLRASPNAVEVFPEIMPPSFMEALLLSPGAPLTPFVAGLVRSYLESPQRLAWCYRAQLLYGTPAMPRKVVENCLLAAQFGEALREVTPRLLKPCTSSSPGAGGSST